MRIVVKIGGSLMKEGIPQNLVEDVAGLAPSHQLLIVHGGADLVTQYATRLGKEQRFIVSPEGVRSRYTDRETAEIYQMVMSGLLAKRLVLALGRVGVKSVSLTGADGVLLQGKRKTKLVIIDERGRKVAIEGGYTGKVVGVNAPLLDSLLSQGYVPVVSPVAVGDEWEPLNVDGDRAASAIATAEGAETIVFLTNVDGLELDEKIVGHMTPSEASARLSKIGFGMQKKVMAAAESVEGGVNEAIICSGTRAGPLTRALAHEKCTVISAR
ncbi:MAG TPA: [LysW]-aminoadipate/[LysW]-glutamate kinase [Nitrososphaerales archaeon]|nr:[LysW]-aminoadipate/[LysW]-glutamate kinase [Nitrososphaerales archaeon]